MNTASLELCKELYKLSGWGADPIPGSDPTLDWWMGETPIIPKYDLGYLMRKLPNRIATGRYKDWGFVLTSSTSDGSWVADYYRGGWQGPLPEHDMELWLHYGSRAQLTEADTPEDAACKLAIELFKQGILKKEPHTPPQAKKPCNGAHCKCMDKDCPNNHYSDGHACPYARPPQEPKQ